VAERVHLVHGDSADPEQPVVAKLKAFAEVSQQYGCHRPGND
jgi:hypothetical protein